MNDSFSWVCCVTLIINGSSAMALAQEKEAEFWLRQAEAACDEITDVHAADRAVSRLHAIHVGWGAVERADTLTKRIQHPRLRLEAHISKAKHYSQSGRAGQCEAELAQANRFADNSTLRSELVDAYLDLAKSPELAISFVQAQSDNSRTTIVGLCEALAKRGYLQEAMNLAESELDADKNATLNLRIALAAAKAGRIADTELAVEQVVMKRATDHYRQQVWLTLADALHKQQQFEDARKFAGRVTDRYLRRRKQQTLRRIDGGPQPARSVRLSALDKAIAAEAPDAANQVVAEMVDNALANPVEPTSGQFGPSNQQSRLAMMRVNYAKVALLYHQAGNREAAIQKLKTAEDAILVLLEQNAFLAWLSLKTLHAVQLATDDIDGLKRTTAAIPPEFWVDQAEQIVARFVSRGDVEVAKKIARPLLSVNPMFGSPQKLPTSEISCFILAGKTQAALKLLRSGRLGDYGAGACENAGRAMIETDRDELLRTWTKQLRPAQRAHVCLGAAIQAYELRRNG